MLKHELNRQGARTRRVALRNGQMRGDRPFGTGTLYYILQNRIYRSEVTPKGAWYPGEHDEIIAADLWDRVHASLATNRGQRRAIVATHSLLRGLLTNPEGRAMTRSNTTKNGKTYRYDLTYPRPVDIGSPPAVRMLATNLKAFVSEALADRAGIWIVRFKPLLRLSAPPA